MEFFIPRDDNKVNVSGPFTRYDITTSLIYDSYPGFCIRINACKLRCHISDFATNRWTGLVASPVIFIRQNDNRIPTVVLCINAPLGLSRFSFSSVPGVKYIEDIRRLRRDMDFMFEWQKKYLTSERSEWVRYCFWHENINPYLLATV
jgi:hypothetical protein